MTDPAAPGAPLGVSELRVHRATAELQVGFNDGASVTLPAEYLRVESPSAEVQGHGPHECRLVPGKRAVGIAGLDLVGHYAVRIRFTDGHDTGIFTWALLRQLDAERDARWQDYLARLDAAGRTRDAV